MSKLFLCNGATIETRPSALGMSDPGVEPLGILETPEFISFLNFFEGMNGTLVDLSFRFLIIWVFEYYYQQHWLQHH